MNESKTAAELLEELQQDDEYQLQQQRRMQMFDAERDALSKEEEKLVDELNSAGASVKSVWDLVNTEEKYEEAIPVLARHLNQPYSSKIKEGIIRALTVAEARGAVGSALIEMFRSENDDYVRWAIGNALAIVAESEDIENISALLSDDSYGESRGMLVHAIARLGSNNSVDFIIGLLADQAVCAQAIVALGNLKNPKAKSALTPFLSCSDSEIRNLAKKAIKKIGD